jgi:hypothetical protein
MDIIKNLKKKIGYALIAASLLAASSVQGSNGPGSDMSSVQGSASNARNCETCEILNTEIVKAFGKEFKFAFPDGYTFAGDQPPKVGTLPDTLQVILIPDDNGVGLDKDALIRIIRRGHVLTGFWWQRLGMLERTVQGVRIKADPPKEFLAMNLSDDTIVLFPENQTPVLLDDGRLVLINKN